MAAFFGSRIHGIPHTGGFALTGIPHPLPSDPTDTGYFWFFSGSNVEMIVKVLDACAVNGHQWVFAGGLTNVAVTLKVRDTQTGTLKTYQNPEGTAFTPIQDTGAFTCP